jgi:hypothetical protein
MLVFGVGSLGCGPILYALARPADPNSGTLNANAPPQATIYDTQLQKQPSEESFVVPAGYALSRGLTATAAAEVFVPGQDGIQLLIADFLKKERDAGAVYVSDVVFYYASQREDGPVQCKVDVYPYDGADPQARSGQTEVAPVQRPVSGLVTEQEYRCRQVNVPVSRTEVRMENQCHEVKTPVSRYETTYTTEYDYATKSSRTVPHTRFISEWQFKNECGLEAVPHPVTRTEVQNQCGYEPVTRSVTSPESQVVPPRPEEVQNEKFTMSAPACYALPAGEARTANRIEAKLYARH